MLFSQPITEIVKARFSCRMYATHPLQDKDQEKLRAFLATLHTGPLGTCARFELLAATEHDASVLKGLGTYGFIKNPTGFIVGAVQAGERNLEDFAYLLEMAVLFATDLGLGTCWLGGSFTQSRFAKRLDVQDAETVPAAIATGYISEGAREGWLRRQVNGAQRQPWEELFFDERFGAPLSPEAADNYVTPLDMVRLGPSASNKQPWRIIKQGNWWHFYLQRTPGYNNRLGQWLLNISDVQRLDMGIAMCHFALIARELGLAGTWVRRAPGLTLPGDKIEYTVSWQRETANSPRQGRT